MCDDIQSKGDTHTCAYLYLYTYYIIIVCVGGWCGCLYILYNYVYETETAKRAGTSEKTWFFPKTQVFWISQISISALSHEVLPLMLKIQQCSYSMLPVSCAVPG